MALNIAVCMKVAPDPDKYNQISLDPVTKTLVRSGIDSVISGTDLHAIELALQLKSKFGGKVTLISMGPDSNEKQLREALGYGCDEAVLLSDRKLGGADALATSYTLYKGIEKMGGYDLVLLGYPIWWYVEPMAVDTFVTSVKLDGVTVLPFATSGTSSVKASEERLRKLLPAAKVGTGLLANIESTVEPWLKANGAM